MSEEKENTHRAHRKPKHPIAWQAYEYPHREKSSDWFWAFGILAVALVVVALLFNNVMFALLIAVGAFSIAVFAARQPDLVSFELNERGLRIDNAVYPFRTLDSFWIEDRHEHRNPRLLIKTSLWLNHLMVIPLDGVEPHVVHLFLEEHLPEEEHVEPFAHHLMEMIER